MTEAMETKAEANGSTDKVSELEQKIIKQIEYYFGDINLGRDKFLKGEIKKEDGWVPLETMIKFKRLASLSEDFAIISSALKKSKAGLMEVNEDNTKIRRTPEKPIPELTADRRDDLKGRSVYVKGFPLDTTLDQVQDFLGKYATVEHINMRQDVEKKFKGSVFAVFAKSEEAEKFLEEKEIKYEETELIKLLKDTYFQKKMTEKKHKKEQDNQDKEESKVKKEEQEDKQLEERITKGAILVLKGLPKDIDREELRQSFGEDTKIAWVDVDKVDKSAKLRFGDEGGASKALEKAVDGKLTVKIKEEELQLEATVLEGEEELEHWRSIFRDQQQRRNRKGRGRDGGSRRGGHGHHHGHHRHDRHDRHDRHRGSHSKRPKMDEGDEAEKEVSPSKKQKKDEEHKSSPPKNESPPKNKKHRFDEDGGEGDSEVQAKKPKVDKESASGEVQAKKPKVDKESASEETKGSAGGD